MQITNTLRETIFNSLTSLGISGVTEEDVLLEHPADKTHGDYSTNLSLVLFGKIKNNVVSHDDAKSSFNSPMELAQTISDQLQKKLTENSILSEHISKIEIASPGFINFTLSDAFLLSKMGLILEKQGDVIAKKLIGKKVMIEFTDPNPFKELHIGHLYSNIVGEAIAKSYQAQGADVERACYQGDVGMHVSKSVWGMKSLFLEKYPGKTINEALAELELEPIKEKVSFLGKAYAAGATAYKDDDVAKEDIKDINYLVFISAQETQKDLNNFEPQVDYRKFIENFSDDSDEYLEVKKMYESGRQWSLDYFESMYSRVGMSFDEFFFESLVGEFGYQIVGEYLEKGVFEKSDGAIIFPGSKHGLHDRVFINSLGLPTYEAKELGLAPEKFKRFKYDKSIIITGNEIDEYFKVLLKALEFTNPDLREKTTHLSHGMVRLPEGKMSSRTGKVITAEWLMNEAHDKIKKHMLEIRPELGETEIDGVSEVIGLGAIKFAFLKQSIGKDISFSFEESLSFSGNSGPYTQYSYVRCHSVLSKAENTALSTLKAKTKDAAFDVKSSLNEAQLQPESGEPVVDGVSNIAEYFDTLLNIKSYLGYQPNIEEKDILRNLYRYSDIVSLAADDYSPHYIANYLYELSQSFNVFYGAHKITDENNSKETAEFRLLLVQAVAHVLKHGLHILGIEVVDKM